MHKYITYSKFIVVAVVPPTFLFQFAVKHQIDKLNKYIKLLFNIQLTYICDYDDVAFPHICR